MGRKKRKTLCTGSEARNMFCFKQFFWNKLVFTTKKLCFICTYFKAQMCNCCLFLCKRANAYKESSHLYFCFGQACKLNLNNSPSWLGDSVTITHTEVSKHLLVCEILALLKPVGMFTVDFGGVGVYLANNISRTASLEIGWDLTDFHYKLMGMENTVHKHNYMCSKTRVNLIVTLSSLYYSNPKQGLSPFSM